jgi:hypothetical protein
MVPRTVMRNPASPNASATRMTKILVIDDDVIVCETIVRFSKLAATRC